MARISALFSKYWRNIHIGIVLVLSSVLIYNPPGVTENISQVILGSLYYPYFKVKTVVTDLSKVNDENKRLQLDLIEAKMSLDRLEEAKIENSRLIQMLGFKPPPAHVLIPAKVISIFGEPFPISVTINRGREDSVRVNQAIINEQGLVGRVSAVTKSFATIQLLTDPTNRVAARIAESRKMGILRFVAGGNMILDNVPIQSQVIAGDKVISSGLGRTYPPGLYIGRIKKVIRKEEEPFCRVEISAAVDFNSLEELFILRPLAL